VVEQLNGKAPRIKSKAQIQIITETWDMGAVYYPYMIYTKISKTVRETEAEAVAFVVSQAIGLDVNTASSDYCLTWGGDRATLAASLDHVQKTAREILKSIIPVRL